MSYATCESCHQEMAPGVGCTLLVYDDYEDGIPRERIAYFPFEDQTCHDCNVRRGQLHHPGCDMERCPRCGGQAFACDCAQFEGDPA